MKHLKKIIAVVLVCAMAVGGLTIMGSAASIDTSVPTVLLAGQGAGIYTTDGRMVYPVTVPDGYIGTVADECLPLFKDAVLSGNYDEWAETLTADFTAIYKDIQLDKNGEASDGTHIEEGVMSDAQIISTVNAYKGRGSYPINAFYMPCDWRLDPFYNAELLSHRIEVIKQAAGVSKVNVVARCEGNSVLAAYMAAHGTDSLNACVLFVSTLGGCEPVSAAFSGNINLEADALVKFYNNYDLTIEDEVIAQLLDSSIGFLQSTYGLEVACAMLKPVLRKLYKEAIYDCVLGSYGTFPGIWTLCKRR